jgi:hypothetical protein
MQRHVPILHLYKKATNVMKKNLFAILILLGLLVATEVSAQRSRYYRYRSEPRMRVYVAPRLFTPPAIGFGWNRGGVFIAPPPLVIGRGLGWRHYHRRGMRCNDRCCRRIDEYERGYNRGYNDRRNDDRRYDDRYEERYDRNNRNRYDDNRDYDRRRDDRRYNQNNNQRESINTDEDVYQENDTY